MRILVADIGGTSIKVGIFNNCDKMEFVEEHDTESKKGGPFLVEKLISIFKKYKDFDAIGISTAGQVDSVAGTIIYANENIPLYTGTKLKEILEKEFHVPVKVENDVNAAALGEKYFGAAEKFQDFLCLTYGTGIGGAIVIDSKVYKGHNGVAAEFGHMLMHYNGAFCNCGNRGCYEAYASTTALIREAKKINPSFINGRIVFEELAKGHPALEQLIDEWIVEVAIGITSLIHCFNPPAVIIGGGIMEQQIILQKVERKVKELTMASFSEVQILKATLGNRAGLLGAASLHIK